MTQELSHIIVGVIRLFSGLAMIAVALIILNHTEELDGFRFFAAFLSLFGLLLTLNGFITLY